MELVIRIGKTPERKTINYLNNYYLDDHLHEVETMENILKEDNITIINPTHFLLYYINNLILRNIVSKNPDLPKDLAKRYNLNPENVKIIEIDDNDNEVCIQGDSGLIVKNYFDELMNIIMNDYYESLDYYEI